MLHWSIAIPFMICFVTGVTLKLFYNLHSDSLFRAVLSFLHRVSGGCLAVFPTLAVLRNWRDYKVHIDNVKVGFSWTIDDLKWLFLVGPATVSKRIVLPEQRKFNAAERLNFMMVMVTYPLFVATGLILWGQRRRSFPPLGPSHQHVSRGPPPDDRPHLHGGRQSRHPSGPQRDVHGSCRPRVGEAPLPALVPGALRGRRHSETRTRLKALSRGRILVAALAALALGGCAREKEPKKKEDPLLAAINALPEGPVRSQEEVSAARAMNAELQATLDEVQNALVDLRAKELKAIKTSIAVAQEGRSSTGTRETLKSEIEEIRKAVRANLAKLDALESANRASGERVAALERLVRELHRQFEEKEETIRALEEKTRELAQTAEGLRGTVKEKEQAVEQMRSVLADREAQLAAAYVLIAPRASSRKSGSWRRRVRFSASAASGTARASSTRRSSGGSTYGRSGSSNSRHPRAKH